MKKSWKKRGAIEVSRPLPEGQFLLGCFHLHCARLEVEGEMKKRTQKEDAIAAVLQMLKGQIHLLQLSLLWLMILSE